MNETPRPEKKARKEPDTVLYTWVESPVARLLLRSDGEVLTGVDFDGGRSMPDILPSWRKDTGWFRPVERQLEAYFARRLRVFEVPLSFKGTAFQDEVWAVLLRIPYGETVSYGFVAREVGRPKGARAVGQAIGQNPISIIVPCHRVVGGQGALTGYGGGMERKVWLLGHEARALGRNPRWPEFRPAR